MTLLQLLIIIFINNSFFRNTIKYGAGYINKYDWEEIVKKKSRKELKEILSGGTMFPLEKIELVKSELDKREKV